MKEKKQNTIDDYISAAEWLIRNKYTNPEKLAAFGESNGGLTVSSAMVQRPDLFKVVVCGNAVLDMLRYHKVNAAEFWKEEYGISDNQKEFEYLYKYSPYHNIQTKVKYPDTLIVVSENDDIVAPWHSFKLAAKMQEKVGSLTLLALYSKTGHLGGENLARMKIEEMAFILNKLKVNLEEKSK